MKGIFFILRFFYLLMPSKILLCFIRSRVCIKINELSCKCSAATRRTNIKSTLSTHIHSNGNVCSKSLMMFAVCFFFVAKMIPKQRVTKGKGKELIFHLKLLICVEVRAYSISCVGIFSMPN